MKKLTITGNLGRDPELRINPEGNSFATFSVAVSVGSKDNRRTDWIDVSCNGRLAEVVTTYAKKGNKVLVDGFPSVGAYINSENIPTAVQRLYAYSVEILNRAERDTNQDVPVFELYEHALPADGATSSIPL
jgi:single-strand DNA-binding protein